MATSTEINEIPSAGVVTQAKLADQIGVAPSTISRWRRNGLIRSINILGRVFFNSAEVESFVRKAESGTFAKEQPSPLPEVRKHRENMNSPLLNCKFQGIWTRVKLPADQSSTIKPEAVGGTVTNLLKEGKIPMECQAGGAPDDFVLFVPFTCSGLHNYPNNRVLGCVNAALEAFEMKRWATIAVADVEAMDSPPRLLNVGESCGQYHVTGITANNIHELWMTKLTGVPWNRRFVETFS